VPVDRVLEHRGRRAKGPVWEHNTHIGDARATDMASAGMSTSASSSANDTARTTSR
jgi:erythromycin esterase-like protein